MKQQEIESPMQDNAPTHKEIASVAYELWKDGGRQATAKQDWHDAEEILEDSANRTELAA